MHWKHYLKGGQFHLYTDQNALESIMKNHELNDRLQNWVSFLMQSRITIISHHHRFQETC